MVDKHDRFVCFYSIVLVHFYFVCKRHFVANIFYFNFAF